MPKSKTLAAIVTALSLSLPASGGTESRIKIDPALFVYLSQCRAVIRAAGDVIWKGWDPATTPVLFYRPGVQDVLIGYPHKPEGFRELEGYNPLGGETVYYRDGKTFIDQDGQNTVMDIDGVRTLVVADTYSNQRNQLDGVLLGRDKEFARKWLDDWGFLPAGPYDQMAMLLHEGFHAFQAAQAQDKGPDEMAAVDYPLLDPENNAFWALEGALMRDALLAASPGTRLARIREILAVRTERRASLTEEAVAYEDRTEFLEGLAKYVEFRFLREARALEPDRRLFLLNGFSGFGAGLEEAWKTAVMRLKDIVAASVDMTGNKFGVGPLRFRLYSSGAALALLLDEVASGWKADIFEEGVYLFDKLKKAVPLTVAESAGLVSRAKNAYGYEGIYGEKRRFEEEGRRVLSDKLKSILETRETLVVLDYSGSGGIAGMAFTPFGVTKLAEGLVLYDMVPLAARFKNGAVFRFTKVIPVLVDKAARQMKFVVGTKAADLEALKGSVLDVEEFSLTGTAYELHVAGNKAVIRILE